MSILIKDMEMPKNCRECPFGKCESCHINLMIYGHDNANCPLAKAPPRGKWILHNMGFGFTHHCSNCKFEVKEQWIGFYNFCPSCGADMRGGKDG